MPINPIPRNPFLDFDLARGKPLYVLKHSEEERKETQRLWGEGLRRRAEHIRVCRNKDGCGWHRRPAPDTE